MIVSSHCFVAFVIQLRRILSIFLETEKGIETTGRFFDISWIFEGIIHDTRTICFTMRTWCLSRDEIIASLASINLNMG